MFNQALEIFSRQGILGLALFVIFMIFLFIIRKNIFPKLDQENASSIVKMVIIFTFIICLFLILLFGYLKFNGKNNSEDIIFKKIDQFNFSYSVPDDWIINKFTEERPKEHSSLNAEKSWGKSILCTGREENFGEHLSTWNLNSYYTDYYGKNGYQSELLNQNNFSYKVKELNQYLSDSTFHIYTNEVDYKGLTQNILLSKKDNITNKDEKYEALIILINSPEMADEYNRVFWQLDCIAKQEIFKENEKIIYDIIKSLDIHRNIFYENSDFSKEEMIPQNFSSPEYRIYYFHRYINKLPVVYLNETNN